MGQYVEKARKAVLAWNLLKATTITDWWLRRSQYSLKAR
jgi:hypothetical protein